MIRRGLFGTYGWFKAFASAHNHEWPQFRFAEVVRLPVWRRQPLMNLRRNQPEIPSITITITTIRTM
jgi:hypothetical protein